MPAFLPAWSAERRQECRRGKPEARSTGAPGSAERNHENHSSSPAGHGNAAAGQIQKSGAQVCGFGVLQQVAVGTGFKGGEQEVIHLAGSRAGKALVEHSNRLGRTQLPLPDMIN